MKNLLFFIPILFFFSCELFEEEEVCTGNTTADLIVGTWEQNTVFLYYTNGDFYDCYNSCNSSNSLCHNLECITVTYNCDGTSLSSLGDSGTWSYDPQEEMITGIGPEGTFYNYITTLNSVHMVTETNIGLMEENGNQINLLAVTSETRIN